MDAKRWGPFSGRQLVVIVLAIVAGVVMTPVAVNAATGSVNIEDATNPARKAKVDAAGRVSVDSGLANFSGIGFTAITGGQVFATPSAPSETFQFAAGVVDQFDFYTPPAGKAAVITSIQVNHESGPNGFLTLRTSALTKVFGYLTFTDLGSEQLTFPSGTVLKAGDTLEAVDGVFDGSAYGVVLTGYLVPASACATGSTCGY
jgi:hypothetical protein